MKSNKDENVLLKIEIAAKMKNKVPVYDTIWVLNLQYENNLL